MTTTGICVLAILAAFVTSLMAVWDQHSLRKNGEQPAPPDIWDDIDKVLEETAFDHILQYVPSRVRVDFTPVGQPCPLPRGEITAHEWEVEARIVGYARNGERTIWRCGRCQVGTNNDVVVHRDLAAHRDVQATLELTGSWAATAEVFDRARERDARAIAATLSTGGLILGGSCTTVLSTEPRRRP